MADVSTHACDVCGKLKGATNHWFKATFAPGRFYIVEWEHDLPYVPANRILHLCGEACAGVAMSNAIGAGK